MGEEPFGSLQPATGTGYKRAGEWWAEDNCAFV